MKTISHGGGDAGYRTFVQYFPDEKLGVAVLSNAGSFNPGAVANRVAEVFLEKQMEPAKASQPARRFVQVEAASLSHFEGFYMVGPGLVLEIVKRGDELVAPQLGPLKPLAANRFWVEPVSAELHFPEPGKVVLTQRGVSTKGERLSADKPAGDSLNVFAGTYWSDELEAQYTIHVDGDRLRVDHIRHGDAVYRAAAADYFTGGHWFMPSLRFTRDRDGKINGFYGGGGRVRGIRFVRR